MVIVIETAIWVGMRLYFLLNVRDWRDELKDRMPEEVPSREPARTPAVVQMEAMQYQQQQ